MYDTKICFSIIVIIQKIFLKSNLTILRRQTFMWLNPHLEIFTPSTKLNPHLCSGKCPTPLPPLLLIWKYCNCALASKNHPCLIKTLGARLIYQPSVCMYVYVCIFLPVTQYYLEDGNHSYIYIYQQTYMRKEL